jgi:hypothetical protein
MDITFMDLVPGHTVTLIGWELDQYALRVRYEVRPPIDGQPPPREARWSLSGIDDLGTKYLSVGGASGVSPDGECSEGLESVQPPDSAATYIDVLVEPAVKDASRHVVRIELLDRDISAATQSASAQTSSAADSGPCPGPATPHDQPEP